jgi:hypothetical protein
MGSVLDKENRKWSLTTEKHLAEIETSLQSKDWLPIWCVVRICAHKNNYLKLCPCDFYLWGKLKDKAYVNNPHMAEEL